MPLTVAFQDGFDHYPVAVGAGTPLGFYQVWQNSNGLGGLGSPVLPSFDTGYRGRGKRLELTPNASSTSNSRVIRTVPGSKKVSMHIASSFTTIDTISGPRNWMSFHDSSMAEIFTLKILPSQQLALYKGATQLIAGGVISTQVAHRFNIAANLTTNPYTVQLWMDGDINKGFSYSGAGLSSTNVGILGLCQGGYYLNADGGNDHGFDDLTYCYDDAVNIGELELITQVPINDILKQWTPLTGTDNFAMVDDLPPDTDTTYNSSAVVGHSDLQGFPALPVSADSIFCLTQIFGMKKDESGTRGVQPAFKGTGAQINGATQNVSTSWDWYYQHYLKNPDTVATWLESERAAAGFGYRDAA